MANVNFIPWGPVAIVLLIVGGLWAYNKGATDCELKAKSAQLESINRAIDQGREIQRQEDEQTQASAKTITEVREKIRYVERNFQTIPNPDCTRLSDEWVRNFNASIAEANRPAAAAPIGYAARLRGGPNE